MPTKVEVHSTWKRAVYIVGFAVVLSLALIGAKKLTARSQAAPPVASYSALHGIASESLLVPVIVLNLQDASLESAWSSALALVIGGQTEVPVANGRVDVLNSFYAIEVDRLDKWHEGIGQAAHYGVETGKFPCVALMVDSDLWPLNATTMEKLHTIEKTASSKGIRLVLLRRASPKS